MPRRPRLYCELQYSQIRSSTASPLLLIAAMQQKYSTTIEVRTFPLELPGVNPKPAPFVIILFRDASIVKLFRDLMESGIRTRLSVATVPAKPSLLSSESQMISDAGVLGRETATFGRESVFQLGVCDPSRSSEYRQKTAEILGIDFPAEYYDRSLILTLVDQADCMCGGALLVLQPEFRSLLSIPHLSENNAVRLGSTDDVAEINGVWLAPGVKAPILGVTFWRQLLAFLHTLDKQRFLFTFDRSNKQMRKITSWLRYDVLYTGPTRQLAGMKKPSDETIAILHRDSFNSLNEAFSRFEGSMVPTYNDFIASSAKS